jgi:NAD+ synthase
MSNVYYGKFVLRPRHEILSFPSKREKDLKQRSKIMELFKIDVNEVTGRLCDFLSANLNRTGLNGFVLGLSGGLDSAVSTILSVRAVGKEKVKPILLPYKTSSPENLADARRLAESLDIEYHTVEITPMSEAYFAMEPEMGKIRRGNFMARMRMAVLYDHAAKFKMLVLGTSNKTEALLGYGTIHGDAAWDINPLWDLYKTQVRELARFLKVPSTIIEKNPTADLWQDQTDEGELGFSYDRIDRLLFLMIDSGYGNERLVKEGFSEEEISRAKKLVKINQFKRSGPITARLFDQYPGCDFAAPESW